MPSTFTRQTSFSVLVPLYYSLSVIFPVSPQLSGNFCTFLKYNIKLCIYSFISTHLHTQAAAFSFECTQFNLTSCLLLLVPGIFFLQHISNPRRYRVQEAFWLHSQLQSCVWDTANKWCNASRVLPEVGSISQSGFNFFPGRTICTVTPEPLLPMRQPQSTQQR